MTVIRYILVYYNKSRYLGMKKEHIEIFNSMEELINYRNKHKIHYYEIYKQIV